MFASPASFNNHWGVPLSLAALPPERDVAIIEVGMNHPGEIAPLSRMVRPDVAVITNVEAVHVAHFESVDDIAEAKAEIFQGMTGDGVAVLNRDNAQFNCLAAAAGEAGVNNVIAFGAHEEAQFRLMDVRTDCEGSDVKARIDGAEFQYRLGVPGYHWVMNSLAVLAAVGAAGGEIGPAAVELAGMIGLKGRGRRHTVEIAGGAFIVIDESYNASPVSMNAAFKVLGGLKPEGGGRRIAILGDMLELGPESKGQHAALVETLIAEKINLVFTAGQYMGALWDVLPQSMRGATAPSAMRLLPKVTGIVRPGDVVVVKGSAGSNTGPIVNALLNLGHPCGVAPDNHKQVVNG